MPIFWRASASSLAAASLTRSAPAFLHKRCMGAVAISISVIITASCVLFLIKAIFNIYHNFYSCHWFVCEFL